MAIFLYSCITDTSPGFPKLCVPANNVHHFVIGKSQGKYECQCKLPDIVIEKTADSRVRPETKTK